MGPAAFLLLFFLLLLHPPLSAATLHKTAALFRAQSISEPPAAQTTPTRYFEVTRPIPHPKTKPCSYLVLQHQFAFTYGKPLVNVPYTPASHCPPQNHAQVVLEWTATCKGRQFDRIFGVWLGGVEIFRSCTAEPRAGTGIVWTVQKDITRYGSLLTTNNTLVVDLRNKVDANYTGVYNATITFHFYTSESGHQPKSAAVADFILPISRYTPKNNDDGPWLEIQNSTEVKSEKFKIPQNSCRAVLEVCVSYHENDEFWYGNLPNSYIAENNLTGQPGNGPFREVTVSLDGKAVGAVWPFTVIYTGGISPFMWTPITGIGSFNLPSYDIELTPFLGRMLDGGKRTHELGFSVTNALNVWYIGANLHLWLDEGSHQTSGGMLKYRVSPLSLSTFPNITSGLNGSYTTSARRWIVSRGWVNSSTLGNVTTTSAQEFEYSNAMVIGEDGNSQTVNQTINVKTSVANGNVASIDTHRKFTLYLYEESIDQGNGAGKLIDNVTLGVDEKGKESNLTNFENADGYMIVNGSTMVTGLASTRQEYAYTSRDSCYARNVSSWNYTIVSDVESKACTKR